MDFDYVIVGGGSAGSVMAARLSEDASTKVCLIEAGGEGKDLLVRLPLGTVAMLPGYGKLHNYAYQTVPQPGLNGRRGYQPRGRVLGGSSALNAMLYVRGHPSDYDDWAAAGATGWGWADVLPYFLKSEGNQAVGGDLHNADGPLQVNHQRAPRPIARAFLDAAAECQVPANDDFNGPEQEGAGLYHVTQFGDGPRNGERCSAAAAYLHPVMDRPNLRVITKARAERVLLESGRAIGVRYRGRGGVHEVRAAREVLLCGGAFNSPQLLMLSGIGPGAELQRHGIEVALDAPQVGQNLQDHLDYILTYKTRETNLLGLGLAGAARVARELWAWRRDGTSMGATPGAEAGAFLKSDPALERPDVQLHFVPGLVDNHMRNLHLGYGFTCHACTLRPWSRGEVGLNSADPAAPPRIDPGYLTDPRDEAAMLAAVKAARRIMDAPAMKAYRTKELFADGVTEDAALLELIRARADTIYHPVGTVRMGDADAPLDPECRVRGVSGLRVVDASVMPTLIGGNTNAPTIMIAEKVAEGMRAEG
ncbi:MAG: GMC family oxidoreductase N-terminal domain-containing protein [Pseudomonadota bacterium]